MRSPYWNAVLLEDYRNHIRDAGACLAFDEIVAYAVGLPHIECEPKVKGVIRTFRYREIESRQVPFAFIVNRQSLLFYIRAPGVGPLRGDLKRLRQIFPAASENKRGEITIALSSVLEVANLMALLFESRPPRSERNREAEKGELVKYEGADSMIAIPAALVLQGDLKLYTTSMKVRDLIAPGFYSVETLDPENANDKGYQRLLNTARAKKLTDYIVEGQETGDAFLPTSVFLATDKCLPYDSVTHILTINSSDIGPFSVVDGQHRLEGLRMAAEKDSRVLNFDVPVNIAENLSKLAQMCHFLIVNTTQKSVDKSVEQRIIARLTAAADVEDLPSLPRWIRKLVEVGDIEQAIRLVDYLNEENDSPWRGKVAMANADRDGATINQKSFVKAVVKYVLTANNPLTALRDFEKEKKVFLNYWRAINTILNDGNSAVLFKYNGVELFCKFSIPFFMKLQDKGSFTVSSQTQLLKACLENVEGEYAGVGHPEWWASGSKASFLNAGAINVVAQEMGRALNKASMSATIEL